MLSDLFAIKSRDGQLMHIATAVTLYQMKYGSRPDSLSNVVAGGFLPEVSKYYSASLVAWKYNPAPARFTESDYEVALTTNGTIVRLKPELFQQLKRERKISSTFSQGYLSIFVHTSERVILDPSEIK